MQNKITTLISCVLYEGIGAKTGQIYVESKIFNLIVFELWLHFSQLSLRAECQYLTMTQASLTISGNIN